MRMMQNTDKEYPCVNCGSKNANIIREGDNPKLKCNSCGMLYEASTSLEAVAANAIPSGPPKLEDVQPETNEKQIEYKGLSKEELEVLRESDEPPRIPRTIDYVFVSRDRKKAEFISAKNLKKVALKWESEGRAYQLFELKAKKSSVKIDIE